MIREVTANDKNDVIRLMDEFYHLPAVLHPVNPKNFEKTFECAINNSPYVKILVSEDNGIIAGYCQLSISYSNEAGGLNVFIEELMVSEEFRNKKIGSQFLEYVFNNYKDAKRFRLEVTKENTGAIKLYKKLGFENLDYLQMILDKKED